MPCKILVKSFYCFTYLGPYQRLFLVLVLLTAFAIVMWGRGSYTLAVLRK